MEQLGKLRRKAIVVLGVAAGMALSAGSVGAAYPTNTSAVFQCRVRSKPL